MTQIQNFADDIFFITRKAKKPVARQYRATFACGSTWDFDRYNLEIPQYIDGKQNGLTHCYDSLRDALAYLPIDANCTIEKVKSA